MSRFARAETATIGFDGRRRAGVAGKTYRTLNLSVEANPRQVQRGREVAARAADIALFYESLHRRLAVFELHRRAGRKRSAGRPQPRLFRDAQPAAAGVAAGLAQRSGGVQQLSRTSSSRTRSRTSGGDRRSAGATTTSSGSAKASRSTSPRSTRSIRRATRRSSSMLRQLRKWALDTSDQGPVSLGYRLGHIRGESRVFRALVYNKGAAVLHMLRRLIGDDAFFRGLRRFYRDVALPQGRHRRLPRGDGAREPASRWSASSSSGSTARRFPASRSATASRAPTSSLRVEQIGEVFDLPVTVTPAVRRSQAGGRADAGHRTGGRAPHRRWSACSAASRSARTMGCWRRSSRAADGSEDVSGFAGFADLDVRRARVVDPADRVARRRTRSRS